MKRLFLSFLCLVFLCSCSAPAPESIPTEPAPTEIATQPTQPTIPTEEPTVVTEPPSTEPPLPVGWFEEEGIHYYRLEDGSLAKGMVTIDGVDQYFTSTGAHFLLVNPWNFLPSNYETELVQLSAAVGSSTCYVDVSCHDALSQMVRDCNRNTDAIVFVVSAYRSIERQEDLFQQRVDKYLAQGYDEETAYTKAATVVAVPGTSEHHTGLAVDIIDTEIWSLVRGQENLEGQKWLMENCWKYGFILRYPADKEEITGIIYEPWHYRYVGLEMASELHELGITLEEYFTYLTNE